MSLKALKQELSGSSLPHSWCIGDMASTGRRKITLQMYVLMYVGKVIKELNVIFFFT